MTEAIFILVMGVSGCGKTTLATALAKELDMPFYDADDLHPKSNVEKMSRGEPLSDADREPWLELVRKTAQHAVTDQQILKSVKELKGVVIACSALKKYYRDIIRGTYSLSHVPSPHPSALPTYIIYISGARGLLIERMNSRKDHFMKTNMLDSQLQTLESPEREDRVITVHLEDPTELQVRMAKEQLFSLLRIDMGCRDVSSNFPPHPWDCDNFGIYSRSIITEVEVALLKLIGKEPMHAGNRCTTMLYLTMIIIF